MPQRIDNFPDALKFAMKLIGLRRRSEAEIRQRLGERGVSGALEEEVVQELYKYRYLDDEAFAESFIRDRLRFRPAGRIILQNELRKKGIASPLISRTLSELLSEETEQELAEKLAAKKAAALRDKDPQQLRTRLLLFLQSRGFSAQMSGAAIRPILEKAKSLKQKDE